jgi:hypothetical protein
MHWWRASPRLLHTDPSSTNHRQDPHSSHRPMVCCSHPRHNFEHFHLPHRAACCSSSLFFDLSTKHPHVQLIYILLMQSVKLLETRTYSSYLLIIVHLPHRRHSSTNYKTCVDDSRPHSYTSPNTPISSRCKLQR